MTFSDGRAMEVYLFPDYEFKRPPLTAGYGLINPMGCGGCIVFLACYCFPIMGAGVETELIVLGFLAAGGYAMFFALFSTFLAGNPGQRWRAALPAIGVYAVCGVCLALASIPGSDQWPGVKYFPPVALGLVLLGIFPSLRYLQSRRWWSLHILTVWGAFFAWFFSVMAVTRNWL